MDISKIIDKSRDKSIKDVVDGKFKNITDTDIDIDIPTDLIKQNAMLMNYCDTLFKTYHKELQKELAKHGIQI